MTNQVIPDAAVAAALGAFWANEDEIYMTAMKRALEAAAPHMLAGAWSAREIEAVAQMIKAAKADGWDEGHKAGKSDEFAHNKGFTGYHDNPYRSQA